MWCRWLVLCLAVALIGGAEVTGAASPSESDAAARIDQHLAAALSDAGLTPSPPADDAEFLRRAWLDLCGIIPPLNDDDGISGVRDFLADERPDKRALLIDALLAKPRHATHLANVWKAVMLPADANFQQFGGDASLANWLRTRFADNAPYDETVRELLTTTGNLGQSSPVLYYSTLELKPEELAASTSRIFLGVQIQCAQCHDHPFDHWQQRDFWGYAAFFARLQRPPAQQQFVFQVEEADTGEVTLPNSSDVVLPQFLGGAPSPDDDPRTRRARLADWLASADNPYFAQATVNRVWGLLFGRGLVDPVDDLGSQNPPSHPELLDELAADFAASGFDVQRLIRSVCLTQAYQRSSRFVPGASERPELFAVMPLKSMSAEQLYDCLTEAMRRRDAQFGMQSSAFAGGFDQNRQAFLARFRAPTQGATEYQSGIPQALTLMNGAVVRQATDLNQSDLLIALDAPFFTTADRVETLFLSTLARPPSPDEFAACIAHVDSGGTTGDPRAALSDVLWALLNSAEFVFNH
jgi:hypothetical protein